MKPSKIISLGTWGFKSRMTVAQCAEQCRQMPCKHAAETRFAEFLTFNFGTREEYQSMLLGGRPPWAITEGAAMLDWSHTSPHAVGGNVIAIAFENATPLEAA